MNETFDITYSDLNPTLLFLGKKNNTEVNRPHTHGNTEMFMMLSGTIRENIGGATYDLNEGDVVMINQGIMHHCVQTVPDSPAILFFVGFTNYHFKGMEQNQFTFPGNSCVLHTEGLVRQEISNLCLKMISERYSNQAGQYFMQKTYLIQLLLILIRQFRQPDEAAAAASLPFETHHKSYVVSNIRQYLTEHYSEKISLDLIARNMYLSSAYISKIFKEETGEAPINFLIKVRLEQARIRLVSPENLSIKSISNSVGYDD
ncbi:MAG: AraC family transcriptional regulator, partial [Parasporobacterium sp.]|nr:AraC family transcriptional regulator [Parasporobacterium sp.]